MNDFPDSPPPPDPLPEPERLAPPPASWDEPVAERQDRVRIALPWLGWVAWPLIVAMTAGIVALRPASTAGDDEDAPPPDDKMQAVLLRMQARYAVGAANLAGQQSGLLAQLQPFNSGPVPQRLRYVAVAGELAGPKEALKELAALEKNPPKHTPKQDLALLRIMKRLYGDYEKGKLTAPSVTAAERAEIVRRLDWFGELALAPSGRTFDAPAADGEKGTAKQQAPAAAPAEPPDPVAREEALEPAYRTFFTVFLGILGAGGVGFLGFIGLVLFLIAALCGYVRGGLQTGEASGYAGVYAETFALWMIAFAALLWLAPQVPVPVSGLLKSAVGMFLSLGVLAWPVVRGVPWQRVREDIGWTRGRNPVLEPVIGVSCWAMSLPLVAIALLGLMIWLLTQQMAGGEGGGGAERMNRAAHPIIQYLAEGDWAVRLQILLLASVAAPIVEETMFRGVLYRNVREHSRGLGLVVSALFSATLTGFVFAVIHPQGWLGVPLLMALAYGFCLAREWRGTLIPAMVGHGLSNGLVLTLSILALSD
jgi:membrane protease YdiL (CAAX protease family)